MSWSQWRMACFGPYVYASEGSWSGCNVAWQDVVLDHEGVSQFHAELFLCAWAETGGLLASLEGFRDVVVTGGWYTWHLFTLCKPSVKFPKALNLSFESISMKGFGPQFGFWCISAFRLWAHFLAQVSFWYIKYRIPQVLSPKFVTVIQGQIRELVALSSSKWPPPSVLPTRRRTFQHRAAPQALPALERRGRRPTATEHKPLVPRCLDEDGWCNQKLNHNNLEMQVALISWHAF